MKRTVDLPDDLLRRAKAAAALRGCKFRDLVEDGLRRVLYTREPDGPAPDDQPSLHVLMKKYCGIADSRVSDLATNPVHMVDFGRDSMGNR